MPEILDIRQLEKGDLEEFMNHHKLPRFRTDQIWNWIWKKNVADFDSMRNIPKALIEILKLHFEVRKISIDKTQYSVDGTIKNRIKLHDDHLVESVLIPVESQKRFTACVSSQVGCSLTCKFCATGQMKLRRNLNAAEIYDQVFLLNEQSKENFDHPLSNIVYMGMGEPLLNYKNVLESIGHITGEHGLGMSPRRITLSTVGIAKMIRKLAYDQVKFNLALSLHAADDKKRNKIMPINESNDLESLMSAIKYFYMQTKGRISYEYIAFKGFNDTEEDARNLIKLCKYFPVRVNIIQYNPIDGAEFERSKSLTIDNFAQTLIKHDIMTTVRKSRGMDIDAACGQLANKA